MMMLNPDPREFRRMLNQHILEQVWISHEAGRVAFVNMVRRYVKIMRKNTPGGDFDGASKNELRESLVTEIAQARATITNSWEISAVDRDGQVASLDSLEGDHVMSQIFEDEVWRAEWVDL